MLCINFSHYPQLLLLFRGTTTHLFKFLGIDILSNYSLKDRLQSANFQFIQY